MALDSASSNLIGALASYLLPCVTSLLAAWAAWQGFRRLHEDALRAVAAALVVVAALQGLLLAQTGLGIVSLPVPLLRTAECASAAALGWTFLRRARWLFLGGTLALGGVLGAFTFSLWELSGAEPAWSVPAWGLAGATIYAVVAVAIWLRRREPLLLSGVFMLLMVGSLAAAAGRSIEPIALRLVAFPLMMAAVATGSTRDLETVQSELASFSEYSLRQTQQLLALLRASTAFFVRADVSVITREAAEGVAVGVGADSALVALVEDTPEQTLRIHAVYPPVSLPQTRALRSAIQLSSQPALDEAVRAGRQVVLSASQRGVHALAALMGSQAGPTVIQPLAGQGRMLGVIVALNGFSQRDFSGTDQRVLEAFGAQVAAAAENAMLDRLIEEQTRELAELLSAREEEASRRAAILKSITDGVIVFDPGGRAIVANPAVRGVLDLSEPELMGRPAREILEAVSEDDYALIRSRMESGQPLPPGFKVPWNGRTVAISVAPVQFETAARRGAVMVLRDITHDAEVDRMKNEFVTVVSHELRTPFAMLDSSMQIIQKYGLDRMVPEQREQLRQLAAGLKRAQVMINNLVTFAAFLSKQGQVSMALVDLGQVTSEVVRALSPMGKSRGVTITLQVAEDLPQVYGSRERLGEAVYHLMHNAIRFNRPGGSVDLVCQATPDDVIFQVSDTGVGIAPDKLPGIWKDFAQLADPLRRGLEGLGLGLPLVRHVVRVHGGQVWANSRPGEGSVFGFSIPVASSGAARGTKL